MASAPLMTTIVSAEDDFTNPPNDSDNSNDHKWFLLHGYNIVAELFICLPEGEDLVHKGKNTEIDGQNDGVDRGSYTNWRMYSG
jgi:hypothetical protein